MRGWVTYSNSDHAVIHFGGNAEAVESNAEFYRQDLPEFAVYLIPYRGYGGNPGEPSQAQLFEDALAIYDTLRKQHQTVSVIGRSLGSAAATYLARHRPVNRLVLTTPFDSIVNVAAQLFPWLPMRWLIKDKFESHRWVNKIQSPTLIMIAVDDQVIPAERSSALLEQFQQPPAADNLSADNSVATAPVSSAATPVKIVRIQQVDHNTISHFDEYAKELRQHFRIHSNLGAH